MHLPSAVVCVALLLSVGCASKPQIKLSWSRPAELQLAENARIALVVESEDSRSPGEAVVDAVLGATQGQFIGKGHAAEPLRRTLGAALREYGFQLVDPTQADVILRVQLTGWTYEVDLGDVKLGTLSAMPGGSGRAPRLDAGVGRLDIKVEALDARSPGSTPFYSDAYWARRNVESGGEPEAMRRAVVALADVLVEELQPERVHRLVTLDDADPITRPGIRLCLNGEFDAAFEAFQEAVRVRPQSASALYNLAVLMESRGEYDQAEALLLRAIGNESKPLYVTALERTREARRDAQALNVE